MATISRPQLLGWMVWAAIRGPIGGPRRDWYHANLAMHAGKPYDTAPSQSDFMPWWVKPELEGNKD